MSKQTFALEIEGMTCASCAPHVEKALAAVPGVEKATVPGWQSGKATVELAESIEMETLARAVADAGYRANPAPNHEAAPRQSAAPTGPTDYDLIVIGTGAGGMAAAIKAAEAGFQAAIIEAGTIGGTCVNIGCVPSKALIRAAEHYHRAGFSPFVGVQTQAVDLDWQTVRAQKDALVSELRQGKYVDVLAAYPDHITLIKGWASLTPEGKVQVGDRTLSARGVILATGARPTILPIPGSDEVETLDSTSVMALDTLPASMIVLGGRAIALELGQAFARFGVKITILQRSGRLIPDHEPEIAEALAGYLRDEGVDVRTGVKLLEIREREGEKIVFAEIKGERHEFRAEQVLMAAGRTPNSDNLGLEEAGVLRDRRGFIDVDEHLQTNVPGVYAVGDVTTLPKFVYTAAAAGGIAAENALGLSVRSLDLRGLPAVIFSDPSVASAGLSEREAMRQGYAVQTSVLPMDYVPRALAARDTRGLIKLVADVATDRLLGAHILAPEAGEMIQTASLAIRFGLTVSDLRESLFPYLTNVEGIKLAVLAFDKDPAMLSCCAV
ncbi:MAG: mercury(II) reductase [Caldilineales bacterium]|nr:mercury(II) reductase [Caldilineales bacterium]